MIRIMDADPCDRLKLALEAIERAGGCVNHAARASGMHPSNFRRILREGKHEGYPAKAWMGRYGEPVKRK